MMHYTCDMCGKPLQSEEDTRYVVKIEVYTACDAMDMDDDIDEEGMDMDLDDDDCCFDDRAMEAGIDGEYKALRFDLCEKCHKKYLDDPLFLKARHQIRFSEN